ncbi:uncharacterized protein LOC106170860 [Lingula anatina]|uniref:Uncharacterized protein LOC106170860 n=1 Tax=Lingula anatina TaxID=7574 RepID=A0A1S3J8W3_LINAN|nr:uncharacterized protein LOC106170860 [Lingula anatina]|eukprot:XP_013406309.1 uncharacterized protein LOC106170860 [Lingula anatina]
MTSMKSTAVPEDIQSLYNLSRLHHDYILEHRHWLLELETNLGEERQKRLNLTCRADKDLVTQYRKIIQLDLALRNLKQTIRNELEESKKHIKKVENETAQLRRLYFEEEKVHKNASSDFESVILEQQKQIAALEQLLYDIGEELSKEIETKGLKSKFNAINEVLPPTTTTQPPPLLNPSQNAHVAAHSGNGLPSVNRQTEQALRLTNLQKSLLEERARRINLTLIVQKQEQRIIQLENYISKSKPRFSFRNNFRFLDSQPNINRPGKGDHVKCVQQENRIDQLEAVLAAEKSSHESKSKQLAELSKALTREVEQRSRAEEQFQSALQELNKHKFVDVYAEGMGLDDTQGLTKQAFAKVNGRMYSNRFNRGFNFLVLNGTSGAKMAHVCFDPFGKPDDDNAVFHYVKNSIPFGAIVVVFTFDEASKNSVMAKEALKMLGASDVNLAYRDAFAMLGFRGHYKPHWVQQSLAKRHHGPAVVNSRIPLIY